MTAQPAQQRLSPSAATSPLRMLALLCVALPLAAYLAVGIYRYQQIRTETEVRLDRSLRIAHEHAAKVFDTNETMIARVLDAVGKDTQEQILAREEGLHAQLQAMARNKPQIQSIWVISREGRLLAGNRVYPTPDHRNAAQRDYFRWHQDHQGLFVGKPRDGMVTGDRFFDMSRARRAADGSFDGLVSVSLFPLYFEQFYRDLVADEPGLAINMVREDGSIIARWPILPGAPDTLSPKSPVMTRIRAGQTVGSMLGVSSVDGRERMLMFRKVGDFPVYVGSGMDLGEVRERWFQEMAWLAAFGLPPLLGLYFAARMALRRTRDALDAAEKLNEETQARRRVEEALLQAQKLEALGRLTGGVAHDFNNALMVISNNLFLLKRKHPDADGPQLASIARAIGSATKLTRQLLAFSRRQALVPEYVRLQEKLPLLQDLLTPVLGSQVQLAVEAAPDTESVLVDAAELELALINLAINARDAMPSGGRFSVSARNAGTQVPPTLQGPMVLVEASDTGAGIPAELLDKVFEPFFTTKPVGEGTGLGLSQVYGLCQRAGGLATVHSQEGVGTTVRLFFPGAGHRTAGEQAAAPVLQSLGKSVLLVEDNDDVAAALQPVLESLGCTVTRMDRAAAARDWLALQTRLPDVVLSDVVMPGEMDGVALAQHVRATYPAQRIVLMTGYAEQLDVISRLGFDILPKPCSAEMLAEALQK